MSTINDYKEASPITAQPLLLAELQLVDGSMYYYSTHPLENATGGYAYGGNNYSPRLTSQDLAAIQARSQQGIDGIPTASITVEDSDETNWSAAETSGVGFRGAILTLRLVYWLADTSTFSSDSQIRFVGIVDSVLPVRNGQGDAIKLTANSSGNLARSYLPVFPIQQRCANRFPTDAASRLAGATNMSHPSWGCGYNPDQSGTDPEIGGDCKRGNFVGGSTPFTSCNYTVADCTARGMYSKDSSNRFTGRYTGETFAPTQRETQSKSYLQDKTITVLSARNDAAYDKYAPMVYGTQWVNAIGLQSLGDGNSTRGEHILCQDNIGNDGVVQFVLNGVILPRNGSSPDNALYRWNFCGDPALGTPLAAGSRNGVATKDALFDSKGDPHGSKAVVEAVCYNQVWQSGSQAQVRVLIQGPYFKTPNTANVSDQATWPLARSTNSAFALLDVLIWSNRQYKEFDLQSFIDESTYCDGSVSYTDFTGATQTHARYKAQFALERKRTAAEVAASLLRSFNAQIIKDPITGLFRLFIRKTLADQQPAPITGSNNSSPITSITAAGVTANGYSAYDFDETNIARANQDDPPFLGIESGSGSGTPNKIAVRFQDEANTYSDDSLSVSDDDAVARAGGYQGAQEVVENSTIIGISNFDQAFRVLRTIHAERFRGNPGGDTRGTWAFPLSVNMKASHLRVGQICRLSWAKKSLNLQPIRIQSIEWSMNMESARLTATVHKDEWYQDTYGQQPPPTGNNLPVAINRLPYPWEPYAAQPIAGDSVFGTVAGFAASSWWSFGVSQNANGTGVAIARVYGCPPVNTLSTSGTGGTLPPRLGIQGSTATTGGTIPGGLTIYGAISAIDAAGHLTQLSHFFVVTTGTGTNTNTATTPSISWLSGSSGYVLYMGTDELYSLTEQARGASTPSTITVTALNYATYGAPDPVAKGINLRAKRLMLHACFSATVSAVTSTVISVAIPGAIGVNQFAGYDLSNIANAYGDFSQVPLANFRVSANDAAGNFTVTPNPVGIVQVGGVVSMMPKPDTHTATTIGDSNLVNAFSAGMATAGSGQAGDTVQIIAGTGRGQSRPILSNTATVITVANAFNPVPDSTTRFVIGDATWQYDNDTSPIQTSNPNPSTPPQVGQFDASAFKNSILLIEGNTYDASGNYSPDPFAPIRIMWVHGDPAIISNPPSDFASLTIDSVTYDTVNATIAGHAPLPSTLNGFTGGLIYGVIGTDYDHTPFQWDAPYKAGDSQLNWKVTMPIPAVDLAVILYAIPYNPNVQGTLVTGVTSPSANASTTISANVPGNITGITNSIDNTDPQISLVTFAATAPSPLHGFNHVDVYLRNITSTPPITDVAHYDDTQQYSGSGAVGGIIQIPKLAYLATYQIWFVSGTAALDETLVQSGGGASATIASIVVPARATTVAPPAPTVGTVTTPTVFFSDLIADNQQHWGVKNCAVAAPSLGWVTGQTLLVQLVRISPLGTSGEQFISELWEKSTTPSTDNPFPTGTNPYLFEHVADFPRPTFSNNETWLCRITPKNSGGDASLFTESATFPVIGGGGGTTAPNVTALAVTAVMDGDQFWIDTVTTLDVNYVYDNFIEHRIVSDVGISAEVDNQATHFDNGDFAASNPKFNVSTRQLTWRIGPYGRPATGTQVWAVRARCYNGKGNQTPSPFESSHLTISAVSTNPGTTGILVTGFTFVRNPTNTTIDGIELASFKLSWVNPTSTDADSVQIEIRDLTTPSFPSAQVLNEQISQYGPGAARSLDWSYPTVNVTLQAIWFTINADGVQIGASPPNLFLTVTAGSGKVDLTRADPSKLSAEFTRNSGGQFTMVSLSVGKLAAGSLVVAMNVSVGGSIVVAGSNFTITVNTSVGVQVVSTLNNQTATLQPGYLKLDGASGNAGWTARYTVTEAYLSHISGGVAHLLGGLSPLVELQGGNGGGSMSLGAQSGAGGGAYINMFSLNSLIALAGVFQIVIGGTATTIIDAAGRLNGPNAGSMTVGGVTFPKSLACVVGGVAQRIPVST